MKIYEQSVGRNSNMLVETVINPDGLVPETDAKRLAEFGKALKEEYGNSFGNTNGKGKIFTLKLKEPVSLKKYVLQEDIQFGERVQSYLIKGQLSNGSWVGIDKGSCIGHKRISIKELERSGDQKNLVNSSCKFLRVRQSPAFVNFQFFNLLAAVSVPANSL